MEIIHLILGKANPERMNGVNKVVYQMATQQAKFGKKVAVWGITKELTVNFKERDFETKLFSAHKNPFKIDEQLKKALIRLNKNTCIHLHGGWIPVYASLSKFLTKNYIPFVLTPHGAYNTIAMQRSKWAKAIYFQLFESNLLKNARKIHSIGDSELDGLNKIFPNKKSFLLPYGYELNQITPIDTKKSSDFIIGFVGRIDIYTKGLDLLLDAFQEFSKNKPNSKLWIIGDGTEMAALKGLANKLEISNQTIFFGSKFGKEKDDLIAQMTVFAHPSRNEGLPASILEACGFGIPSIASIATNITKFLKEYNAGIAIENENVPNLIAAFEFFYDKWKKNQLDMYGKNAQLMVQNAFNWEKIIDQLDELYL